MNQSCPTARPPNWVNRAMTTLPLFRSLQLPWYIHHLKNLSCTDQHIHFAASHLHNTTTTTVSFSLKNYIYFMIVYVWVFMLKICNQYPRPTKVRFPFPLSPAPNSDLRPVCPRCTIVTIDINVCVSGFFCSVSIPSRYHSDVFLPTSNGTSFGFCFGFFRFDLLFAAANHNDFFRTYTFVVFLLFPTHGPRRRRRGRRRGRRGG